MQVSKAYKLGDFYSSSYKILTCICRKVLPPSPRLTTMSLDIQKQCGKTMKIARMSKMQ